VERPRRSSRCRIHAVYGIVGEGYVAPELTKAGIGMSDNKGAAIAGHPPMPRIVSPNDGDVSFYRKSIWVMLRWHLAWPFRASTTASIILATFWRRDSGRRLRSGIGDHL